MNASVIVALLSTSSVALQIYWQENCIQYIGLDVNWVSAWCKMVTFTTPMYVDTVAFEAALIKAMLHVGHDVPGQLTKAAIRHPNATAEDIAREAQCMCGPGDDDCVEGCVNDVAVLKML